MAIRIRRGNQIDFDKNKLVQGELAIVLDAGELHFCYGAGNTKKLATKEDLQEMLDMSETSYSALIQLIADLEDNPNELTNILNNISALQSGKLDKAEKGVTIATLVDGKVPSEQLPPISSSASDIAYDNTESGLQATDTQGAIDEVSSQLASKVNKTDIVNNDTTGGVDKVASAEVVKVHGQEIDTLTNNLDPLKLGLHMIKNVAVSGHGATLSHTMNKSDFNSAGAAFENTGTYLLVTTSWSTTPSTGLYLISYSGGATTNSTLTTIVAQDGATVTATSGVISASGSMARIRLYAFS